MLASRGWNATSVHGTACAVHALAARPLPAHAYTHARPSAEPVATHAPSRLMSHRMR